jgi:hypothetical protein
MHYLGLTEYIYRLCVYVCVNAYGAKAWWKRMSATWQAPIGSNSLSICVDIQTLKNRFKDTGADKQCTRTHAHTRTARSSYTPVWGNAI